MYGKVQFHDRVFSMMWHAATAVLMTAILPACGWAQNPVPPTARQAAQLPEFAQRLARYVRSEVAGKPPASPRARAGRPSPDDYWTYENGPVNGTTDAWTINFGYVVSDSFTAGVGYTVTAFDFYTWEFPGDVLSEIDWSITSSPNGGTVYGSGKVSVTDSFISTNQYGYNIDKISASGLNVSVSGTAWLNLQNAVIPSGDPVYWDENSGAGCRSAGCPSQAVESGVGTIPSEAFDISGNYGSPPPPPACFEPDGNLQVIHDFTDQEGGGWPSGAAVDNAGNVYGATGSGGDNGFGFVYKLSPKGKDWLFTPLYSFMGGYNGGPSGEVIVGPDGALYGTAGGGIQNCYGGSYYCGLVYRLRPPANACLTASCSWTEEVLYRFTGDDDAWGGGASVFDLAGNLYGISGTYLTKPACL